MLMKLRLLNTFTQKQNNTKQYSMIELNKIYNEDCLEGMKAIEDNSIDLAVADPPYWKVINEQWDYQWRTESDYVEWCIKWIKEVARVLRIGGTFYCFGYFRTLVLLIPYLESLGLELRQQIVIDKGMRAVSGRATRRYKIFPNVTESVLFIIKDNKKFVKPFLKERQETLGLTAKQINEALGVKSNGGGMWSIYTGNNVCEQFPTKELWDKLSHVLSFDYPYEKVAQTFNPQIGVTDVWSDIDFYEEKHIHPTQKPLKLIRRLIMASSNEDDIVLDPFSGVGTTQVGCVQTKRNFIGFELNKEYYDKACNRIKLEMAQLTLF